MRKAPSVNDIYGELGFEQAFACIVFLLLCAVYLHTRIQYGNMVVTHITTRPYKIAIFFLMTALLESIYLLINVNVTFKGDFHAFRDYLVGDKSQQVIE